MNFSEAFNAVVKRFNESSIEYALIGGLALHYWGYSRSTHDIDFIVLAKQKETLRKTMEEIGFHAYAETENVVHYEKENFRIDIIYAQKMHGFKILERACEKEDYGIKFKVAKAEDIIGLKVQSLANNPLRWLKEMADIENLLLENKGKLDTELIGDYFSLFNLQKEWESLSKRYHEIV